MKTLHGHLMLAMAMVIGLHMIAAAPAEAKKATPAKSAETVLAIQGMT